MHTGTDTDAAYQALRDLATDDDGNRFTLDGLDGRTFPALAFGATWNGWATPIVTRAVLTELLSAMEIPDALRADGSTLIVGDSRGDVGPPNDESNDVRLEPLDGDAYDLAPLGWVFTQV